MSYNLHITISEDSPEEQALSFVMSKENISAEEAVLTLIRRSATTRNYATEGKGLFSSPEDSQLLDEAIAIAMEERKRPSAEWPL